MTTKEVSIESALAALFRPIIQGVIREEFERLPRIENTVQIPPRNRIGGIDLAKEITGKAESTIYNLVHAGKIPHSKQSGKLYFSEETLLDWIQQGKRKSAGEVNSEVDSFLGRRGGRKQVA